MHDIVRPQHSTDRPHHGVPALPKIAPPSLLERALGRMNEWGGKVSRKVEPGTTQSVIAAPLEPKKRRMPRGVATKAARAVKKGAGRAREEIKKPGRKTALAQTVALGALFALFLNGTPWQNTALVESQTSVEQKGTTRRYLPNIATDAKFTPLDAAAAITSTGKPVSLYGWVTPWNITSPTSEQFNSASAFWLTVNEDGATVAPKADWAAWDAYRSQRTLAQTFLTVSGDPNYTYKALTNLDTQSAHIAALLNEVKTHGFDGIDIDYEGLGLESRELFTSFIRNLTTVFHQSGKKVAVTVEARIANQVPMDWQALGQIADEVRIMAYDYHARSTATPGPISPLAWVAEIVSYASDRIEAHKIVIGLGNYGYDWIEPLTNVDSWEGNGISFEQAIAQSTELQSPIIRATGIDERGYDIGTIPTFGYTDSQGREHQVWFEDATSLQEKVDLVAGYQVKGIMFWSVGSGDPAFWQPHL